MRTIKNILIVLGLIILIIFVLGLLYASVIIGYVLAILAVAITAFKVLQVSNKRRR